MSGGMAFVYDEDGAFPDRANPDSIVWQRLASAHWQNVVKSLLEDHLQHTGSRRAAHLLAHWDAARRQFWQICPIEMIPRLKHALNDDKSASSVAAE